MTAVFADFFAQYNMKESIRPSPMLCALTDSKQVRTVKAGNVVTFLAQNNFFLRISCRWPNVICSYIIQLKKGLDVGMAIFGFCQHLGPFF